MPLDFPPIFLLPTHLQLDDLHRLEASIPSLTYDIHEAQVVLGNISRTQRARFELRRLKVETEPTEDPGPGDDGNGDGNDDGNGKGEATASELSPEASGAARVAARQEHEEPSAKRRRLSASVGMQGQASHNGGDRARDEIIYVLRLAWFEDSVKQGRVLPKESYTVYRGRKLASVGRHKTAAAAMTTGKGPRQSSPATAARDILERAAGDQGAASGSRPSSNMHRPPPLVRQTTSEHDVPLPPIPDYLHTTYSCQRPTPLDSPNELFIEELKKIRTLRLLQGDQIGVRAYSTAIATLAAYPHELQVPQEIERLPGCGAKFAGLYGEWRQTGQTKETANAALDSRLTTLKLFYDIWGVGDTTALEFYRKGSRRVQGGNEGACPYTHKR
ncbi:DNA-directed DNA polymerase [Purpureocillium takamizusanense]|uniref:DNA-directed DNA polymerase n=1 Tax=Purpureocillium takamizusanense TaxID=2060973 RepID=A0A9Q8QTC5_9HYPO|nr:DNA-directed DNA polymerase [Purpureocillium takamizusanense]UNI24466.1 DNA-directed DNA polymerase [Purpureocillium takamizusanense]